MDLELLKKEIPYKWRIQSSNKYGANCVSYIDSRDVQELLDESVGPNNWQSKFYEEKGNLFCSIGILIDGNWVWKSDCGTESHVEKQKGEASDAFKRAAVMWGIGRFLYKKTTIKLPTKEKDKKFIPFSGTKNRFVYSPIEITNWCEQIINSNGDNNS